MLHKIRIAILKQTVSHGAMRIAQFHHDRVHPAPWRARQDRMLVSMLTQMVEGAEQARRAGPGR